jgi:hypothetical protein
MPACQLTGRLPAHLPTHNSEVVNCKEGDYGHEKLQRKANEIRIFLIIIWSHYH